MSPRLLCLTLKKRYKPKRVQLAMMGNRAASLLVMVSGISEEFCGEETRGGKNGVVTGYLLLIYIYVAHVNANEGKPFSGKPIHPTQ